MTTKIPPPQAKVTPQPSATSARRGPAPEPRQLRQVPAGFDQPIRLERGSTIWAELTKRGINPDPRILALVAQVNDIENFRKIPAGKEIVLPKLDALSSGTLEPYLQAAYADPMARSVVEKDQQGWSPKGRAQRTRDAVIPDRPPVSDEAPETAAPPAEPPAAAEPPAMAELPPSAESPSATDKPAATSPADQSPARGPAREPADLAKAPPVVAPANERPAESLAKSSPLDASNVKAETPTVAPTGVGRAAGPTLSPRQSLTQLVSGVWQKQAEMKEPDDIYGRYGLAAQPVELPVPARAPFINSLIKLSQNRPQGAESLVEGLPAVSNGNAVAAFLTQDGFKEAVALMVKQVRENPTEETKAAQKLSDAQLTETITKQLLSQLPSTSFRYVRAGVTEDAAKERIVVHAKPEAAMQLMDKVVRGIVDKPGDFPGVASAEVVGPAIVGVLNQSLVIYTDSPQAADRVVKALEAYRQAEPQAFLDDVPPMMTKVSAGIARGEQPPPTKDPEADPFGSLRVRLIFGALQKAREAKLDAEGFQRAVDQAFLQAGIDPQRPDRNLAPAPKK